MLVPDNTKTGVTRASLYEPDLNPTYQEFAAHYKVAVMPTRTRKPRDEAKVESAVQVVQRWIVMRLIGRRLFSVAQINEAIAGLLTRLNNRPFRKRRDESRASLFAKLDKPGLQPLPAARYDLSQWAQARVNIDYHVAFDGNWYSVPYALTGEAVEIRSTPATVEIFHRGKRVASHLRSRERNKSVCHNEHRPKSQQAPPGSHDHLSQGTGLCRPVCAQQPTMNGPMVSVQNAIRKEPVPKCGHGDARRLVDSCERSRASCRLSGPRTDRRPRL
jgi:transposase